MSISESIIDQGNLSNITSSAIDAANILDIDAALIAPTATVAAVDLFVHRWQQGDHPVESDVEDIILVMASLWGEQLVKQLDWEWTAVSFAEDEDVVTIGVASPDRSLAIFPFHFVQQCLSNDAPVTIQLAFDLLVDGSRIPEIPAGTFENVMNNVHHKTPRT